ncbi:uncharacterized protein LTR77_007650 [Saxophila tyrrhenica]|uniref:Uncharacterized protein n=1 Tax=Saxophila tyrrhenica TaxID=1690608 RepID=A0AAV9P341_9PEZI|nr:hypothetical protein LTR77_007650 [Saxophila tyrrhenica]
MPPKKSKTAPKDSPAGKPEQHNDEPKPKNEPATNDETTSTKRKKDASSDEPQKAPRRSGRGALKSSPSHRQLLNYLLSNACEDLCRPDEEAKDIATRGSIKTYSGSVMNPFEELLSAAILSRPISHRLGLRTIRTVFNDPYNFNSAHAVQKAGHEKHLQAVYDARTQHKDKTAAEIGQIADTVLERFTSKGDTEGTELGKALSDSDGDVDAALDAIKSGIKGIGETGMKIFLRRVQWLWMGGFPYVDDRTQGSLKRLGLPEEAAKLEGLLKGNWSKLDAGNVAGKGEEARQRRAFVVVLERAIGADLEGKVDQVLEAAAGGG